MLERLAPNRVFGGLARAVGLLAEDVEAIRENAPAARTGIEVLLEELPPVDGG